MSSWNSIDFIVITSRRQLSAVSKCRIRRPPLSVLICLRSKRRYQKGFSVYNPVNTEFVIIGIAIRRTQVLPETFFWVNWHSLVGMANGFASVFKQLNSTGVSANKSNPVFWYSSSRAIRRVCFFFLLVMKTSDKSGSKIAVLGSFSKSYPPQCRNPLYSKMAPLKFLKM